MTMESEPQPETESPKRMLIATALSLPLIIGGLWLMMKEVEPTGWIVLALGFVLLAIAFFVRPNKDGPPQR